MNKINTSDCVHNPVISQRAALRKRQHLLMHNYATVLQEQGLSNTAHELWIEAGGYQSRNYKANVYPYRASSHFLYLTGLSLPGACLRLTGTGHQLHSNMAVTIEPGIYFIPSILDNPKYTTPFKDVLNLNTVAQFKDVRGIRIEDDVLMSDHGAIIMTAALEKSINDIEALRQS